MNRYLIILHPHLTIPGGAGKVSLELGKRLAEKIKVIIIAQKVNQEYIANYPEIRFESLNGPLTDSFLFWLLFPYWQMQTTRIINRYAGSGEVILFPQVFPANWIGLIYKYFHPNIKCLWFCQEPSAFIHIRKWRQAIQSPLKRWISEVIAPVFALLDKRLMHLADEIFVNSKFGLQMVKEVYKRNGVILYPGVDTEQFKPVPFKEKGNYILTVARLTRFKNIDILINAFSKISNKEILLHIVGDGEEKESLIRLSKSLGLENRVSFLSGLNDAKLAEEYAKARIFVLCSKDEPFGIVPVEAMACGTPVIADNSGGPRETVLNNETGRLIACSEETLRDTIDEMLSDEAVLEKYSLFARKWVEEKFTWQLSAKKLCGYINVSWSPDQ